MQDEKINENFSVDTEEALQDDAAAEAVQVSPQDRVRKVAYRQQTGGIGEYLLGHIYDAQEALIELVEKPLTSFLAIIAMGIVLAMALTALMVFKNVQTISHDWNNSAKIVLYLNSTASADNAQALLQTISQRADVGKATYVSPEQGLEALKQNKELNVAAEKLSANPLPSVIKVLPAASLASVDQVNALVEALKKMPEVEVTQFNHGYMQHQFAMLDMLKQIVNVAIVLFAIVAIVILVNRLQLAWHQGFRPLFYSGIYQGLLGGLFAWLLIEVAYRQWVPVLSEWLGQPLVGVSSDLIVRFLLITMGLGLISVCLTMLLLFINPPEALEEATA